MAIYAVPTVHVPFPAPHRILGLSCEKQAHPRNISISGPWWRGPSQSASQSAASLSFSRRALGRSGGCRSKRGETKGVHWEGWWLGPAIFDRCEDDRFGVSDVYFWRDFFLAVWDTADFVWSPWNTSPLAGTYRCRCAFAEARFRFVCELLVYFEDVSSM